MPSRAALLALLLLLTQTAGAAEPLRLAANNWPPFTDRSLPGNGLATDLVSTALSRAGYRSQYIEVPWARVIKGVQQGNYDVVLTAWYSADREAWWQAMALACLVAAL